MLRLRNYLLAPSGNFRSGMLRPRDLINLRTAISAGCFALSAVMSFKLKSYNLKLRPEHHFCLGFGKQACESI